MEIKPVTPPEIAPARQANSDPKRKARDKFFSTTKFKYHMETKKQENPETKNAINNPRSVIPISGSWPNRYIQKLPMAAPAIPVVKLAILILFLGTIFYPASS